MPLCVAFRTLHSQKACFTGDRNVDRCLCQLGRQDKHQMYRYGVGSAIFTSTKIHGLIYSGQGSGTDKISCGNFALPAF